MRATEQAFTDAKADRRDWLIDDIRFVSISNRMAAKMMMLRNGMIQQAVRILVLAGMAALALCAHADENQDDKERAAKVEALIKKLAGVSPPEKLSDDEERSRNRVMVQAWMELRDLGVDAFPQIAKHLGDEQLSFSRDSGSTDET